MAIIDRLNYQPCTDPKDPDDYRPRSAWAVAVDPEVSSGSFVDGPSIIVDRCAPGDRVPLHTHTIDEVVVVQGASAELRLGHETRTVPPGAVMFVPRGTPHGGHSVGEEVTFVGFFTESVVETTYLERNPAPGRSSPVAWCFAAGRVIL
jgi:quercetin dioxygenase-like cupin family protein